MVLLGISDSYISKSKLIFSKLYDDFLPINSCAFRAGGYLWVYAAHPLPGNGHFDSWVSAGIDNSSGQKRILALQAINHP